VNVPALQLDLKLERKRQAAAAREAVDSHRDEGGGELFGIADLCREFDITLRTIRFYEDKGLLSPRREYTRAPFRRRDRARLIIILRSKALGATLEEIKAYLDLYGAHGEGRVQQLKFVLQHTDAAIAELETKRAHIETSLAELRLINQTARRQLESK